MVITRHYPGVGGRNQFALDVSGALASVGVDTNIIPSIMWKMAELAGDDEPDKRRQAAQGTCKKFDNGEQVTGIPNFREFLEDQHGPQVARKILNLLARGKGRKQPINLETNDIGNAERFIRGHRDRVLYETSSGTWYVWDGRRWKIDDRKRVYELARQTVQNMAAEGAALTGRAAQDMLRWAAQSHQSSRIESMVREAARAFPDIKVTLDELDASPWLFNARNGVIDLRTSKLLAHDPGNLITKLADVEYDPDAKFEQGRAFLLDIFDGDAGVVRYLQKMIGYTATGEQVEAILAIFHGGGRNGKGTLTEILAEVFGDYAVRMPRETFLAQRNESIPTDVVDLMGTRFAYSNEGERGRRLAESKIKDLTGGDTVVGRRMHKDFVRLKPTHTLFLSTNHRPEIQGTDIAIWERVKLFPFEVTFVDNPDADKRQRKKDTRIREKLASELSGWMRWVVEGCRMWQAEGLADTPAAVKAATNEYRDDMDVLAPWLSERCYQGSTARSPRKDL